MNEFIFNWLNDLKLGAKNYYFFLLRHSSSHTLHSAAPPGCATLLLSTPATPFLHDTVIELRLVFGWRRLAELADRPTGCSEVTNGGCAFASNEVKCTYMWRTDGLEQTRPCPCIRDPLLINQFKIPLTKTLYCYIMFCKLDFV